MRTRTRSFTKPFVVTVAAAAACGEPAHENPPRTPTAAAAAAPATASAAPSSSSSTAPVPAASSERTWTIERDGKASSCTVFAQMNCPAGAKCNPPPPAPYPCPPKLWHYPATIVRASGASECRAVWTPPPVHCPVGASCNPPPPQDIEVPCPE